MQPAAYREEMIRRGWWSEPELSPEAQEAFRWYMKLNKWRLDASGALVLDRLKFDELLAFRQVYDSSLDNEYLFEVVNAIDTEYLQQLARRQSRK